MSSWKDFFSAMPIGVFVPYWTHKACWVKAKGMNENKPTPKKHKDAEREDRLKAALKANMGRRKAQARARNAVEQTADKAGPEAVQDKD